MSVISSSSYRTRDIARAVHQSPRTVQRYLEQKYPNHEGWHSFTDEEFQALVSEMKAMIPVRQRRRSCWLKWR